MATDSDLTKHRRDDLLEAIRQRELEPDEPVGSGGAVEQPTDGLTDERSDREIMLEWDRHYLPGKANGTPFLGMVVNFARAIERAAIAAHLASQSQAAQPSELTDERLAELFTEATSYILANEDFAGVRLFAKLIGREVLAGQSQATKVQAEPVAWMNPNEGCAIDAFLWQKDPANPQYSQPVYAAPVAKEVQAVPELTVWEGAMPESNGKSNFTAVLMRKGATLLDGFEDGFTIACSEYPDRVRYEADCVRYLIGELAEKPWITDYDADKHSGYVNPTAQEVTQPTYWKAQRAMIERVIIGLRDGWATRKDAADALVTLAAATPVSQEVIQQAAPVVPTGWQLVPIKPDAPMLTALWNRKEVEAPAHLDDAYAAMLAVAPVPATQQAAKAETAEQAEGEQANALPPTRGTDSQHDAGAAVLSALRDGIPLQEPVNITKAVLAQREARACLSGGIGPLACAMLVNIQLTPWADGPEKAEAFASGYNTAMKWYRAALLKLAESASADAASRCRAQGGEDKPNSSDLAPTTSTVSAPVISSYDLEKVKSLKYKFVGELIHGGVQYRTCGAISATLNQIIDDSEKIACAALRTSTDQADTDTGSAA
jgi:hypothetical protein